MMDRSTRTPFMASMAVVATVAVAALTGTTEAYVSSSSLRRSSTGKISFSPSVKKAASRGIHRRREDGSSVTLYLFPSPASAASHRRKRGAGELSTTLPAMSSSVLAESDTLPSFQTAHGLLSPEVVTRIADVHAEDLERGEPLHRFLKTYKREGPMACLPMLSDPCILPELTKAMREIA